MKRKFEYSIVGLDTTPYGMVMTYDSEATLNDMGNDGWELVSVSDKLAFFKREITNE